MKFQDIDIQLDSPFHLGEQKIQTHLGVRDKMERFGKKVIRSFMPQQHRDFYQQLPFIFVGHADDSGNPWASILFDNKLSSGDPQKAASFIDSPNDKTLNINAMPVTGDPLINSLKSGTKLGLLGIELTTRRRNRLAAHIKSVTSDMLSLEVDQSFGNCPQYIQNRELVAVDTSSLPTAKTQMFTEFDNHTQEFIANRDTFFVASHLDKGTNTVSEGADVSHRGGKPGFIRIDNHKTLTIPDYMGNNHFNTFGNFIENNKAGLLFVDFETGDILTLTGTVEILWDSPDTKNFEGAQRLWQFHITQGFWLKNVLPLRWKLIEYSANTLLTGTWQEAEKFKQAQKQKESWLDYQVVKIERESSVIKSFYLQPKGHQIAPFKAGQFLTIKEDINNKQYIRTYTISSAPYDDFLRLSIKQEQSDDVNQADGVFSNYMHEKIKVGDVIKAKAPRGDFTFDAQQARPAVLIAGGIGITPLISMARHALIERIKTRSMRNITMLLAAKNVQQRAFFDEINQLVKQSDGHINAYWALSEIDKNLKPGKDFHQSGRISKALIQAVLALDDYEFYICGPNSFMQNMYDILQELGVNDQRIYAEAFGPAALKRVQPENMIEVKVEPIAEQAIIEFTDSAVEQAWNAQEANLLEFAESHGFEPEFSCRSGQCGACKTTLISGEVVYQIKPSAEIKDNEVLLCCAKPAKTAESLPRIKIKL
jgi:ferredoxin-NADP reductase/predicted pyridoxine 5'-phosphate oxidase superfamily flavin-nucleotide-binding protein